MLACPDGRGAAGALRRYSATSARGLLSDERFCIFFGGAARGAVPRRGSPPRRPERCCSPARRHPRCVARAGRVRAVLGTRAAAFAALHPHSCGARSAAVPPGETTLGGLLAQRRACAHRALMRDGGHGACWLQGLGADADVGGAAPGDRRGACAFQTPHGALYGCVTLG